MEGIYKKLLIIQNSIENFVKNKQSFNYSYVDGNTVLNHIRPLMNDTGLILKQEVLSIDNERYDYTTSKGIAKTEVLSSVQMRFTWVDCETGEKDENLFGANGMNDFDKGVGSALTYAERYFLLKYFHIPTDKDDLDAKERDVHNVTSKNHTPVNNTNGQDRPWLNKDSKEHIALIKRLKAGTTTVKEAMKYFKINKEMQAELETHCSIPDSEQVPL